MWIQYLAKFLLYVGVDIDVIHTVRHFPLTRRSLRPAVQSNSEPQTMRRRRTTSAPAGRLH